MLRSTLLRLNKAPPGDSSLSEDRSAFGQRATALILYYILEAEPMQSAQTVSGKALFIVKIDAQHLTFGDPNAVTSSLIAGFHAWGEANLCQNDETCVKPFAKLRGLNCSHSRDYVFEFAW